MQALFQAILARRLDRIAAAYAVAGWLLVQVASIVLPAFDAPAWTLRTFIVAVALGFPAALLMARLMTSPRSAADAAPIAVSHREIALLALLGAVLLLSLGELLFVISRAPVAPRPMRNGPADASIAVLAFDNMSDNRANEYFSDGISEELLNELAQVPGLRVVARTSSFSFKGKSTTIRAIGRALDVGAVLEGSVRREQNRVRITAELIDVRDDLHIWSASYDRQLSDILGLETEISHTIARALTGRLLPAKASVKAAHVPLRIDPEAYTAFLQGRFL
ncbi:MAG TPA: hypothetical protein VGL35_04690 [Rhizomicrobium sp.]|jgi:TolB-like protein